MSPLKLAEFLKQIPKTDLHVHLDGSIRISTLIELAKKENIKLPAYTEDGLNELVFKERYEDLLAYLQGFGYTVPVLQTPENLERVSYEFALDTLQDGVCYVEVRFAPQLHVNSKQDMDQVLLSVNKGMNRAKTEYNSRPEVKSGVLPEFNYGIIVCAMRAFFNGMSPYFDSFLKLHKYSELNSIYSMASLELIRACIQARDKYQLPIVAFDLAGPEAGNPAVYHQEAFQYAHKNFMNVTVHAGEAYGPESIFQAITDLYADRIGHGYYLFSKDKVASPTIKDKANYVSQLAKYVANRRVTLEVCLTSNLQTIPLIGEIQNHSFREMLKEKLSTTLCTDNRTVSKTCMTKELLLAIQHFGLTPQALKEIVLCGFEHSFYPGSYVQKTQYLNLVKTRYELLETDYLKTQNGKLI